MQLRQARRPADVPHHQRDPTLGSPRVPQRRRCHLDDPRRSTRHLRQARRPARDQYHHSREYLGKSEEALRFPDRRPLRPDLRVPLRPLEPLEERRLRRLRPERDRRLPPFRLLRPAFRLLLRRLPPDCPRLWRVLPEEEEDEDREEPDELLPLALELLLEPLDAEVSSDCLPLEAAVAPPDDDEPLDPFPLFNSLA